MEIGSDVDEDRWRENEIWMLPNGVADFLPWVLGVRSWQFEATQWRRDTSRCQAT